MLSDKQKAILAFPYTKYTALICDGAVRSGKTSMMMVAFIDWAMANYNNVRFGIVNELDAHSPYEIRGSIKEEIIDRVRCADILFSQDRIKIVDGACEDLCDGFRTAVWDEKHDDRPLDDGTYDRDIIDAFDYSMTPHITQLVRG